MSRRRRVIPLLLDGSGGKGAKAITYWMRVACIDWSLGYDQSNRWDIRDGGECDCSSLVIWATIKAGYDIGVTLDNPSGTTREMFAMYVMRGGWTVQPGSDTPPNKPCVLLNTANHAAWWDGNGHLYQASQDENGGYSGGQSGDQANETNVRGYYNYPWNYFLFPPE